MKVIIVGGVAGGASTAARLRRLDENAQITVYERSGYMSYANCGLPYYIGGIIEDRGDLTLQTPESFYSRFRVDVRVKHEVVGIDPAAKTVRVRDLETGREFTDCYDKLVLATGAKPFVPDIPGADEDGIFVLRTVEDTFRIYDHINGTRASSAMVVGGGFIGLECAENLKHRGLDVTVVEAADQLFSVFDPDMAAQIHTLFAKNGVKLRLSTGVESFSKEGAKIICTLSDGEKIPADTVIFSIGVRPDTDLAKNAGISLGVRGSISVNDRMETSAPDIYAVGDAVEVTHFVTGEKALVSLAGPANRQGRIAADNIAGGDSRYAGSLGSSVIRLFDMTAASVGISERQAAAAGIGYSKVVLSPASHASYYPGGSVMTMKVIFSPEEDRILGAQIFGREGADKRIDVIATAMRAGMTATGLSQLELAYAPPYSSAKDPVNMAGFMIENLITGKVKQIYSEQVDSLPRDGSVFLLDTRTPGEYARGHAEGFVNIPLDELRERLSELPKGKTVYVMCQSGLRSYIACRILSANGFECFNVSGGYRFFSAVRDGRIIAGRSYCCGMDKNK